jgi:hypothetical protein
MMITNFLQKRFNYLLVFVEQFIDVLPQFIIKEAYFLIVSLHLVVLELPHGVKFALHFLDIFYGSPRVLMGIRLPAGLAQ